MVSELWVLVLAPLARSVAGWAEKALADGKIELFEVRKLLGTLLRLGVPSVALYYGFALDAEFAAAIPLVVDYVINAFVKYSKKVEE